MMVAKTAFASAPLILPEQATWPFEKFDTQPGSSVAHEVAATLSLQSKCWPGPGGIAHPTPAVSKTPPIASPRARFMLLSPFPAALGAASSRDIERSERGGPVRSHHGREHAGLRKKIP